MEYDNDDLDAGELIGSDDQIDDDFEFYLPLVLSYEQRHYTFVNWYDQIHATSETSNTQRRINIFGFCLIVSPQ